MTIKELKIKLVFLILHYFYRIASGIHLTKIEETAA